MGGCHCHSALDLPVSSFYHAPSNHISCTSRFILPPHRHLCLSSDLLHQNSKRSLLFTLIISPAHESLFNFRVYSMYNWCSIFWIFFVAHYLHRGYLLNRTQYCNIKNAEFCLVRQGQRLSLIRHSVVQKNDWMTLLSSQILSFAVLLDRSQNLMNRIQTLPVRCILTNPTRILRVKYSFSKLL